MIAISVSIIIYGGISYSLSFGDEKKQLAARNVVIYALTGILIGLASLAIIELVLSITKSSLHF
jgi:high-affinity K+ transport system ATPase subunit B